MLAYATLSYDEAAARSKIGEATLRRIASASAPRGATTQELMRIADACEVPHSWLLTDWHEKADWRRPTTLGEGDTEQRLEVIEDYLRALLASQSPTPASGSSGAAMRARSRGAS
jgi:transposase